MIQKQKILFSDLDGTLLDDHKEMEADTREAVYEMLEQGHIFVLCTGRPLASAKKAAQQLGLNRAGFYISAYNGGVLYDPSCDKIISYASIPLPLVHRMFQEAEAAGLYVHTYDRSDTVRTRRHTQELDAYIRHTKLDFKTSPEVPACLTEEPAKMIVISNTDYEAMQEFHRKNAAWTAQAMNSFFSCEQYLEYCPAGISKGTAVHKFCEYLNIPVEASIAAGDERNDIAMLETAGLGAAPANAHPDVCACAGYICEKDNNQGAVGEIIRKFILNFSVSRL